MKIIFVILQIVEILIILSLIALQVKCKELALNLLYIHPKCQTFFPQPETVIGIFKNLY